ncbi:MAG: hypothetical protein JXR10_12285 [Cyclobacteriaceae bacterium]
MRTLLLLLLMISADPSEISRNNSLKSKGEKAFVAKDYATATSAYSELYDTLSIRDPKIGLNLAHSHFALGDTANAKLYYQGVAAEGDRLTKSIAYQQLGVLAKKPETLKESLQYLKSALKANPSNEEARYNYELVKKQLDQQQQQQDQNQDQENQDQENQDQENQDQENQDQENQDQENQENQDGEQSGEEQENQEQESEQEDGEQSEEQQEQESKEGEEQEESDEQNQQQSTQEKLEEMNISEDKARMILEAMKNNEIQYIQQQKRKATKPQDSGKPDW